MLGIYVRLSQIDDSSNSIENQLRQGKEFAKTNDLEFKVYNEGQGLSGGLGEEGRPMLNSLLNDIRNDVTTSIWVRDQSRLERNTLLYFTIIDLCREKGVKLYYGDKFVDVDNDEEMLPSSIMSLVNQLNRRKQGKLTKKAINDNFRESKSHGILPYGFTSNAERKLIVNEFEAVVVKRIFALSLEGVGINKIAEIFNSEGVPTRYNMMKGTLTTLDRYDKRKTTRSKSDIKWSGNSIRGIITNPAYKGQRRSGIKTKLEFHPCPAIVEATYWDKVNDNLKNNRNNSGKVVDHIYLLKGLLRCGKCGRNYYGRTRENKKDNFYMCSSKRIKHENCGNRSINIDVLDKLIWTMFRSEDKLAVFIQEHFKNNSTEDLIEELKSKLSALELNVKRLDKDRELILDLVLSGAIERVDVQSRMEKIRNEKIDCEKRIYNLKEQLLSSENLNFQLNSILNELKLPEDVAFEDKKALLKKYIKNIKIYYNDQGTYYIEIEFNLFGMDSVVYVVRNNYKIAHTTIDASTMNKNSIAKFIILDENLELTLKNGGEIDVEIDVESVIKFNTLKESI